MNEMNQGKENAMTDDKNSEDRHFVEYVENNFEELWKEIEAISTDLSKKDLAKKMFILGNVVCRETISNLIINMEDEYSQDPEAFEMMLKEVSLEMKASE